MATMDEDLEQRRRAAVRTAIALGGLAIAFYVALFFLKG
jgi:hypothetical protein